MLDLISGIIAGISLEIWTFIFMGLVAVVLVVGIVLAIVRGDMSKFTKVAKAVKKDPTVKTAKETAKKLPKKGIRLFARAKTSGGKYSEHLTVDACVNTPYINSIGNKLAGVVLVMGLFSAIIVTAMGVVVAGGSLSGEVLARCCTAGVLVAIVSLVCSVIAIAVNSLIYKGAVSAHSEYVAILDGLSSQGKTEIIKTNNIANDPPMKAEPVYVSKIEPAYAESSYTEPAVEPVVKTSDIVVNPATFDEFDGQTAIAFEQEIEPMEMVYEQPAPRVVDPILEPISYEQQTICSKEIIRELETEIPSSISQEKIIVTASIDENSPLSPSEQLRIKTEQARAQRAAAQKEAANSASAQEKEETKRFFEEVERVTTQNGKHSEIKALAMQLSQERLKPYNQTPELKKRFSEIQLKLLTAMKTAPRG